MLRQPMARYGLISDTHGYFDPRLPEIFRGVDLILHGGDVGHAAVLSGLRAIAPLVAVRGNNDRTGSCARLPLKKLISLEGILTLLIHRVGKPERPVGVVERLVARHRPALVVYGHSHLPADELRGRTRWVNPGSAGKKRFRLPRACALLRVHRGQVAVHHLSLE